MDQIYDRNSEPSDSRVNGGSPLGASDLPGYSMSQERAPFGHLSPGRNILRSQVTAASDGVKPELQANLSRRGSRQVACLEITSAPWPIANRRDLGRRSNAVPLLSIETTDFASRKHLDVASRGVAIGSPLRAGDPPGYSMFQERAPWALVTGEEHFTFLA